jgi:gas vesicle protein GvpN
MDERSAGSILRSAEAPGPDGDHVLPEPSEGFVLTPAVERVTRRALTYLEVGYPVHFAGPTGTGKTTLAFHVAAQLGRPITLIHGDDEFGSSDLVGRSTGYRRSRLVDNFIHSVMKTEEEMESLWVDNRLTTACQKGETLIYDEFNRSRPEANNALLSVLSERLLNLPKLRMSKRSYLEVHSEFRAIFTSNPEEYAGVHKAQDALMDRLITIALGHYDRETEVRITMARSGIERENAGLIVDIARELRQLGANSHRPTVRACIAIARVLKHSGIHARWDEALFREVCQDVFNVDMARVTYEGQLLLPHKVAEVVEKVCRQRQSKSPGRQRRTVKKG